MCQPPRLRRLGVSILLLALASCVDTGPTTTAQIDSDINSGFWMRNQIPPAAPGALPSRTLSDITTIGP
jgi:hypothetical protein